MINYGWFVRTSALTRMIRMISGEITPKKSPNFDQKIDFFIKIVKKPERFNALFGRALFR